MGKYWGELNAEPEIDPSIAKLTPAERFLPKPYTLQGPHDSTPDHAVLRPPQNANGDNIVLHCIDLIRHNRVISNQKERIHHKIMKSKGDCETPPLPTPPNEFCQVMPGSAPSTHTTNIKLCPVPAITQSTADLLLRKSAASILCHVGYTTSTSDTLDVLSSCLGDYMRGFCLELRRQQDNVLMNHKTKYSDAFEETLYAQGIRGYDELMGFARSITTDYVLKLDNRRQIIESEYGVILRIPQNSARSMPGHLPNVNTVDLLKGTFETEPTSPQPDQLDEHSDTISRDVFIHNTNGLFFH